MLFLQGLAVTQNHLRILMFLNSWATLDLKHPKIPSNRRLIHSVAQRSLTLLQSHRRTLLALDLKQHLSQQSLRLILLLRLWTHSHNPSQISSHRLLILSEILAVE
jgi:hypothetical protein